MPSNGQNEYLTYGIDGGAPLFTYGMIGLTTIVIAYATMTDGDAKLPSFLKSDYTNPNTNTVGGSYNSENKNKTLKKDENKKRRTIRKN
jgi:hypothetical protein